MGSASGSVVDDVDDDVGPSSVVDVVDPGGEVVVLGRAPAGGSGSVETSVELRSSRGGGGGSGRTAR